MERPIIGMTAKNDRFQKPVGICKAGGDYIRAVAAAGGAPVLLPETADGALAASFAARIDGLLLPGGGDVAPFRYGEDAVRGVGAVFPELDAFEFALLSACAAAGKPVFGICRGLQVINVFFGGTLWQDIPTQLSTPLSHYGVPEARSAPLHRVVFAEGSRLRRVLGADSLVTNSFHHQCVKEPAPGFSVSARAADGVIEGIESEEINVFAVQFHPENLVETQPVFLSLFRELVERARQIQN